jgi:hypothetical protein
MCLTDCGHDEPKDLEQKVEDHDGSIVQSGPDEWEWRPYQPNPRDYDEIAEAVNEQAMQDAWY